jgi:hypothetical protein
MFSRIGDVVIHIPTPRKATSQELKYYRELMGKKARCKKCGAILKPGDFIDHYFPYEDLKNRCKRCYKQEIEGKEKLSEHQKRELIQKILESAFDNEDVFED